MPDADAARSTARVLYIEDDADNVELVRTLLAARADIELVTANCGRAGLRSARERRPDLVLLDLAMPDMSGIDVLLALRSQDSTADVPIVVITADGSDTAMQLTAAAGVAAYLVKPLEIGQFLAIVDRAVSYAS